MKHLNVRYTIRLSDYLSNEMIKYTLNTGQDYSSFIRMCITNYLKNKTQNNAVSDIYPPEPAIQNSNTSDMSATKTHNSGVIDDNPVPSDMFGSTSNTAPIVDDSDSPFSPSMYGWD